ncbi:DoxX family protein [Spirosoma sp. KCTC 42546]|uniref:DoxX family protein n=1 Tax=Spirosoma sp. KCTC 42546 TaxID=2520506 RepID=UPI00115A9CF4|nr:DoxX family protein [Spirosoma sp. KCTC 42546]QDK83257.1 DoxX family protein [Spirosoma sp. KCTC 42546]
MSYLLLWLQALIYIAGGVNHFINPKSYLAIMPPYIPAHSLMVTLSGIAELILGIGLLFPATRSLSAWGIMLLLIAIFPANVYMATSNRFRKFPAWLRWARLPLQGLLIWWAYQYT